MRKFFLITLLIASVVLTGCSQKDGLSQDELFEKKQECASYVKDIEIKIEEEKNTRSSEWFKIIFYSETRNSCIYIVGREVRDKNYEITTSNSYIYDYFTKETLAVKDTMCFERYKDDKDNEFLLQICLDEATKYESFLKELKGE